MEVAKMKYCGNCKQWITTTKGVSWLIAIILLCFFFLPGIVYILWAASRGGKCPICNSKNWSIPTKEEEIQEA